MGEKETWFDRGAHAFSREITVPFPWESKLSGIADPDYRGVAWYAREVTIPQAWQGKQAWVIFGAVDFEATVWANGWLVGRHVGGYTPFAVNLSRVARPGDTVFLVVRAKDVTDPHQPTGKQVGWYTRTSGIWQTVYLEARRETFVERLRAYPSLARSKVAFEVDIHGRADKVVVETAGRKRRLSASRNRPTRIEVTLDEPRAWHPDDPHLYDATITLEDERENVLDRLHTYFGMRDVGVAKAPGGDYKYITLNGKPIYLRGALHQSFHPDGVHQYPSDEALRRDYAYARDIGLNFLRIHIKAEIPRALYWADRLGILIMQDIPNSWRHSAQAREWIEATLRGVVERDFNHPSIFSWCNFNETWGLGTPREFKQNKDTQEWVREMYELTKSLDPTRLVEDNSPCNYDHVATDINSWHFYINDYERARDHIQNVVDQTHPGSGFNYCPGWTQSDAPLINSEYGGISAGHGDQDISWSFKYLTNELRRHGKICGYVYTELSDIEWEHNGFLNYDRSEKEYGYDFWFPHFDLKDITGADFVVLDVPPCQTVAPGEGVHVPVAISHFSSRQAEGLQLRWQLRGHDGRQMHVIGEGTQKASWSAFQVKAQQPLRVTMPDWPAVASLNVELLDAAGARLAANYVNFHVFEKPSPRVEVIDAKTVALRFQPADFAQWSFADGALPTGNGVAVGKVFGLGAGQVEYRLAVPQPLRLDDLSAVRFSAELSAKAGDEKLDWPARKRPVDYPQTDNKKWPTVVRGWLNGFVFTRMLPDDPADARGVLSHHYGYHPGSYGYLVEAAVSGAEGAVRDIAESRRITLRLHVDTDAEHVGGLAVFGERLGRFPLDPTILLTFRKPHGLARDFRSDEPVAVNRIVAVRRTVLPTAEEGGAVWRYTTTNPGRGWQRPRYDDTSWHEGRGGFGTRGTPNAVIGTKWNTPEIWLRTTFQRSADSNWAGAILRFYHDEDVDIHINGQRVLQRNGYVTQYVEHALVGSALAALKQGDNVIAVHCRQTGGGQKVDVGLQVIQREE